MEVYVISLLDNLSQKIVSDTYKKLESKNIKFKKFDAIDGYDIKNKNILDQYSHKIKKDKLIRTPGRIGCLASHLELLKKCSKDNKNYLILEQDACLMDDVDINILNKCSENCKDIVLLDPYSPYEKQYEKLIKQNVTTHKLDIINNIKNKIKLLKEQLKQNNKKKKIIKNLKKLTDKLKYEENNILFHNYHYKFRHNNSKGSYCYIVSPEGSKIILQNIKKGLVPADYLFTEYKNLDVKTTSRTIFRINSKYTAGVYSSTLKNYKETKLKHL